VKVEADGPAEAAAAGTIDLIKEMAITNVVYVKPSVMWS